MANPYPVYYALYNSWCLVRVGLFVLDKYDIAPFAPLYPWEYQAQVAVISATAQFHPASCWIALCGTNKVNLCLVLALRV